MSAQPDQALMHALAEVMISEERARSAADREIAADLVRLRERVDDVASIIDLKVAAATAHLKDGKDGIDGLPGPRGEPGPPGTVATIDPAAMLLPPELAAEVARAVRTLHEAPLVAETSEPKPAKVVRIERDAEGNLVPVYDD